MESTKIFIPSPDYRNLKIKVQGTAALIYHKWSEKAIRMIEDKQQKKAKPAKEARNPEQEYKDSFYYDSKGKIAIPIDWFKQAMVNACRLLPDIKMTLIRSAIFMHGDEDGLIPVKYKVKEMRTDMVKIGQGTSDIRYRGQLKGWEAELLISYNAGILSAEMVLNLLATAGMAIGVGEWRQERGGNYGAFSIINK